MSLNLSSWPLRRDPLLYFGPMYKMMQHENASAHHLSMISSYEHQKIKTYLRETREPGKWYLTSRRATNEDWNWFRDIVDGKQVRFVGADFAVLDDPTDVLAFIGLLPKRTVEIVLPRKKIPSVAETQCLRGMNYQFFKASSLDERNEHLILSTEDCPRALVELMLRFG